MCYSLVYIAGIHDCQHQVRKTKVLMTHDYIRMHELLNTRENEGKPSPD